MHQPSLRYACHLHIFQQSLFFTFMVILTIFFVAWLFSSAFLELIVNKFTKNLCEKTKSCKNSQLKRGLFTHWKELVYCRLTLVQVVLLTKIVYQAKLFESKQVVYQVVFIPKQTYTEVSLYILSYPAEHEFTVHETRVYTNR